MKTYREYTEKDSYNFKWEGRRRKTVAFDMISKGKVGGDSDAMKARGGVERYDKYDKGSPKQKRDILQKELEYYLSDRHGGFDHGQGGNWISKSYKELNKNQRDELWDDIDDKFSYNTKTYKKGSLKIVNGKVK